MKSTSIAALGFFAVLSSVVFTTNAQSFIEPAVKILPGTQKGFLKVLYAYSTDNSNQDVTVRFFNNEGDVKVDEIKQETFSNGFLKKYDIRKLATNSSEIWVEVKSANVTATYKLNESKDGNKFVPALESATASHQFVAANN